MPLNFTGKDLRGRSFRGVNLAGTDFSGADIRGSNFSNTTLIGANFSGAKAGLQNYQMLLLTCFALSLSAICGFAAVFSGIISTDFIFFAVKDGLKFTFVSGAIALVTLIVFCVLVAYQALEVALGAAAVVGAVAIAIAAIIAIDGVIAGSVAGALVAVGIAVALVMAVTFVMMVTLTGSLGFFSALLAIFGGGVAGVWLGEIITRSSSAKTIAITVGMVTAIIGTLLAIFFAKQVFSQNEKFDFIRGIGIHFASIGGTSFQGSHLTGACFQQAILKHADFSGAILTHTDFHLAEKLDCARLNQTILFNPQVRDLLVTKRGNGKSYINCNLKGANLTDADLNDADFTNADVSEATFVGAWLERANLTKVQAIKANFQQVRFTAACLEAWNIDSTTEIDEVVCDYVYLLNNQGERRQVVGYLQQGNLRSYFKFLLILLI
jgi:uncharacterized protein YjbI with pentapeptide repeats